MISCLLDDILSTRWCVVYKSCLQNDILSTGLYIANRWCLVYRVIYCQHGDTQCLPILGAIFSTCDIQAEILSTRLYLIYMFSHTWWYLVTMVIHCQHGGILSMCWYLVYTYRIISCQHLISCLDTQNDILSVCWYLVYTYRKTYCRHGDIWSTHTGWYLVNRVISCLHLQGDINKVPLCSIPQTVVISDAPHTCC